MPWDKNLEISKILNKHVLILNKYPVEDCHMILITNYWQPQDGWINKSDWEALSYVEKDTRGLWFFNNSPIAGASQPHRHIQFLPRTSDQLLCPRQKWFEYLLNKTKENNTNDKLELSCMVIRRNHTNDFYCINELESIYYELCTKMHIGNPTNDNKPICPYNLLITKDWFCLIRRSIDTFQGFDINALGFAGYFLVKNESNINWFYENSPEYLLSSVVKPINS